MALKIGHLENRSEMSVLKCGAGEGWRSDGSIVWEMKKYYRVKEERNTLHTLTHRKTYLP